MPETVPESGKKPGVCYAFSESGLELPVIDISHPAFHQDLSVEQLFAGARRYAQDQAAKGPLARWLQRRILPFFLRRSLLGRGLLTASKRGYLDGLSTYLLKLGPRNLGSWAGPMDRKLAAGINASGMSLGQRLQDMAEILAHGLKAPLLGAPQRPLQLISLAGGPAMDCLNALILLYKEHPQAFSSRKVGLQILDLDTEGPRFGAAALAALQSEGGPLRGLAVRLDIRSFDWSDSAGLAQLLRGLAADVLLGFSSEGGLFDYGGDEAVLACLRTLRMHGPADTVLAASLSRPNAFDGAFSQGGGIKLQRRELEDLQVLAQAEGWGFFETQVRPVIAVAGLKKRI